jgi:hypothetical protein
MFKAALRLSALAPRGVIAVTTTLPVLIVVLCNAPLLALFCCTARGRVHTYQLLTHLTAWTAQLVTSQPATTASLPATRE